MTAIQGASDIAVFIRRQLETMRASPAQRVVHAGPGERSRKGALTQAEDLPSLVFRRIRLVDPGDPDRRRKVFRVFIESVLLFELGDELINDAKFHELVATVQERMAGDTGLAVAMNEASDRLVAMIDGA